MCPIAHFSYVRYFIRTYSCILLCVAVYCCRLHNFYPWPLLLIALLPGQAGVRVILIGEFFPNFSTFFFRAIFRLLFSRNFSIFHIFLFFFPNIGMLTNLIFLFLENFTVSDRIPPYIYAYLQLFPNFGN